MNKELEKLSGDAKQGLNEAYDKCPKLSKSVEHKLMFLRCEQFNADVSITILYLIRISDVTYLILT